MISMRAALVLLGKDNLKVLLVDWRKKGDNLSNLKIYQ